MFVYLFVCLPLFGSDDDAVEDANAQTPVDDVGPVVELPSNVFLRLSHARVVGQRELLESRDGRQVADVGEVGNRVIVEGEGRQ